MTRILATTLFLAFAPLVIAQPGGLGLPPSFKMVTNVDQKKGQVFIQEIVYKAVPVTVQRAVIVNGKQEIVTETRTEMVAEQRVVVIEMANSRVITPDEKQLALDDVWKKLKTNSVIVMSADGKTPGAGYLRALNPEALVIIPGPPTLPKKE
jgi:hypothetical protein